MLVQPLSGDFATGDCPPNPLEKAGYTLEFHDEFDGPLLDTNKWLPFYLPHWSSRAQSAANYYFEQGNLVLQITADQQPWCSEFDGAIKASSIQTGEFAGPLGSKAGLLRFHPDCVVREAQPNVQLYTPQYGYFEMRAKATEGIANHVALWMIGYEEIAEHSAEICICEIFGKDVGPSGSKIGHGVHPWSDPAIRDEWYEPVLNMDATQYHIYAAEWTPTHIDYYVDNIKITTIQQSPHYPMVFMLDIFERPLAADTIQHTLSYPQRFVIDYFRAYQPNGGYMI